MTMKRIDDQVQAAAALATQMVLELAPESRATLIRLRSAGWRAAIEYSFDDAGFGSVSLTAVSPDGERRAFGQVAHDRAH